MTESRLVRIGLRVVSALVLAFLYLPLIILAIYAFNEGRSQAWPPSGLGLDWFADAAGNPAIREALLNSLIAASGATVIALVLGTLAALAVQRFTFFGRETISFLFVLPIALPGVVTGIALRTTFQTAGVDFGLFTIIVGHATFCVVIAYNNVIARLRRVPKSAGGGVGRPRSRYVDDLPTGHPARAWGRRCSPEPCWRSRCRSTRSSSRTSRPARARRRFRCGSTRPSSGRTSCRSSTWWRSS